MLFSFDEFEAAVERRMGVAVAGRLRPWAAEQIEARQAISENEAGAAIIGALLQSDGWAAANVPLRAIELSFEGRSVVLEGEGARDHPLLSDWVGPYLANAFGKPILAGGVLTFLAPGAPAFAACLIAIHGDGTFSGEATLRFPHAVAIVKYGPDGGSLPYLTLHQVQGDTLFAIGGDITAPSDDGVAATVAGNQAAVMGGTLH